MVLRMCAPGTSIPYSFILDPDANFLPGMACQLTVRNNQVMATVSNGIAPIGVIDDIRTRAFSAPVWQEVVIVPATGVISSGQLVTPIDIKAELKHAYVDTRSFISTVEVALNPTNGVITFPAGTPLNYDMTGSGTLNAIRTIVNYSYQVPNIPGDDSTIGSGRITVWYTRIIFQTDQYETNQVYPVNANLYVSENGLWTTRRPSENHAAIGMVTAPPVSTNPMVEILFY